MTKQTQYPGGGAANRVVRRWFDWRDRPVTMKAGVETGTESESVNRAIAVSTLDNLGQVVQVRQYDGDGVTPALVNGLPIGIDQVRLVAQSQSDYDALGENKGVRFIILAIPWISMSAPGSGKAKEPGFLYWRICGRESKSINEPDPVFSPIDCTSSVGFRVLNDSVSHTRL